MRALGVNVTNVVVRDGSGGGRRGAGSGWRSEIERRAGQGGAIQGCGIRRKGAGYPEQNRTEDVVVFRTQNRGGLVNPPLPQVKSSGKPESLPQLKPPDADSG
jgi:hypothetical protein